VVLTTSALLSLAFVSVGRVAANCAADAPSRAVILTTRERQFVRVNRA
jgi:hypothetical protein